MKTNKQVKTSLLVVDDEEEIRQMLSRHYRYKGHEVDTASNGENALSLMANKKYHVVITDIKMPVMNGIQLLRQIRQEYPMTYCIMMTGYVTMENVLSCMRHGAETCVFKPLEELAELDKAVKQAINDLKHWEKKLIKLLEMKP
ncbi:MAG: response regulator [bacterium]